VDLREPSTLQLIGQIVQHQAAQHHVEVIVRKREGFDHPDLEARRQAGLGRPWRANSIISGAGSMPQISLPGPVAVPATRASRPGPQPTSIPEAFHNSPRFSRLLAAFGFGLLLLVEATTR
jgi:hypothetical protein